MGCCIVVGEVAGKGLFRNDRGESGYGYVVVIQHNAGRGLAV